MFDVVYYDPHGRPHVIAAALAREAACELATSEARNRGIGRMFLAGSSPRPTGEVILIVTSFQQAA